MLAMGTGDIRRLNLHLSLTHRFPTGAGCGLGLNASGRTRLENVVTLPGVAADANKQLRKEYQNCVSEACNS